MASFPLEWPAIMLCLNLLLSVRQCVHVSDYRREHPGCNFPDFLQSKEPGFGDWTWKYSGFTHVGKVHGGVYTICSKVYSKESSSHVEETCPKSEKYRICIQQHGSKYVVQHGKDRQWFQCIEFIQRSLTIVQLALSVTHNNASTICDFPMTVDHSPWISVKYSALSRENCPFIGGYNFHEIQEFSKDHQLQRTECKRSSKFDLKPAVRIESDCVDKEGIKLHFKEEKCVPAKSYFSLDQRLVCVASWEMDGHGFAVLKKDQGEFAFYCIRVEFDNREQVSKIVMYLDWECYRTTDLSPKDGTYRLGYSTSYVEFTGAEKHMFTIPCKPGIPTCSEVGQERRQRQHLHHLQTEHRLNDDVTCQHCLNSTGYTCDMNHAVINTWTVIEPLAHMFNLTILPTSVHHPNFGTLQCVTFDPKQQVALRSILWGVYQNGCYPRFMCMYYDTPFTNILRYRVSNVLQWPVTLNDEEICHRPNFITQPDFNDPKDSPWYIAYAHKGYFRPRICVIPSWLPSSVSFVDDRNRTGCITFRSRWSAKRITFHHVRMLHNGSYLEFSHGVHHNFHCLAAMSYLSTYKTSITQSEDRTDHFLCWMYVDSLTVIVIKTSSCNRETADGILRGEEKYIPHLQWLLKLDAADPPVRDECRRLQHDQEVRWQEHLLSTATRKAENWRNCSQSHSGRTFLTWVFSLCMSLRLLLLLLLL